MTLNRWISITHLHSLVKKPQLLVETFNFLQQVKRSHIIKWMKFIENIKLQDFNNFFKD